jgi:hypothetical protein
LKAELNISTPQQWYSTLTRKAIANHDHGMCCFHRPHQSSCVADTPGLSNVQTGRLCVALDFLQRSY